MKAIKKIVAISMVVTLVFALGINIFAYQLGGSVSGTANGISCYGYAYRDTDGTDTVSSEATAAQSVTALKSRVYYTEYSTPNPSSIPSGSLASTSNKVSSGYSTKTNSLNPTHVKGWNKVNVTSSVAWEAVKDYTFGNHSTVGTCKLCTTNVNGN